MQVANHGPSDAPDVVVRDSLPPGLTFVSDTRGACSAQGAEITCLLGELASGAAIDDWQIDVRIDPSLAGRTVRNAASIASEPSDPALQPVERIPSSNEDAADLEVAQTANLRITKTVTPATVAAGGEVAYAIRVTNDGPGEATDVRAVDVIPDALAVRSATATQGSCDTGAAIICDLGTLSPGATAEVRVTAGVGADRAGSTIVNAAAAAAAEVDLDPADNRASASLSVVAPPSVALSLAVVAPAVAPSLAPDCLANVLRLVDVAAGPTRVQLAGETAKANAGRTVTLLFRDRRVGTAIVTTNGTFAASLPLPPRDVRTTNQARYEAVLGPLHSLNLKLARRMRATELSSRAGDGDHRRPRDEPPGEARSDGHLASVQGLQGHRVQRRQAQHQGLARRALPRDRASAQGPRRRLLPRTDPRAQDDAQPEDLRDLHPDPRCRADTVTPGHAPACAKPRRRRSAR